MRFDQFRTMVLEANYFGMRLLPELEWEDGLGSEWIDLLDDLGRREGIIHFRYPPKGKSANLLSETFCSDPSRVGILRVLGYIARRGIRLSIPANLLEPERYSDPKFREAAILVRLAQSGYSQDEAKSLVKHLIELREESPYIVNSALNLVGEHCDGNHLVNFCLELRKQLPSTDWETIGQTIRALNDFLRRRTGRLEDPHVWSELGLPKSLYNLLR